MSVPRVTVPLGAGILALIAGVTGPLAQMSEMDGFDKAVTSGSKEDALAFIREFGSSHLVPDLIDLLPPDVAAAVCADLGGNSACDSLQNNLATEPAAGTVAPELATNVEEDDQTPVAAGPRHDGPGDQSDTSGGSSSGGSSSGGSSSGGSSSGGRSGGSSSGGSSSGGSGSGGSS